MDSSAYRMFRWIDERTALPLVVADATLLNPTFRQIRRYASDRAVTVLPLRDRLAFRQVSRKWWGRLLRLPAALFVRILDLVPRRMQTVLAVLYPFLVVRIEPGSPRSRDGVTVQR